MSYPILRPIGFDGLLVTFGDKLSAETNRAALAFRKAVQKAGIGGVRETSTSLVSTLVTFDPLEVPHAEMEAALQGLLSDQDWFAAPLPEGRTRWRIPAVFGGEHGPQLAEAAKLAGVSEDDAIKALTAAPVTVQTIGFAPGMPYLGELAPEWDIPRQTELTAKVPAGGLCVAIRQLVLFPNDTPTGWRHIARTRVRLFRPETETPFLLKPGDEVHFLPVSAEELDAIGDDPTGGAEREALE